MRRIVNGKRYDTETATLIAEVSAKRYYGDINTSANAYWEQMLYRSKKGAYFIAHYGPCRREDRVEPLTDAQALDWLEKHEQTQAIETHFESQIEDA